MQLKDQVLGEVLLVAPNNPSNANIAQSKLVSPIHLLDIHQKKIESVRCIDGNYPGDLEVPNEVRLQKLGSDVKIGHEGYHTCANGAINPPDAASTPKSC